MKNLIKKWWFWLVIIIILIGSFVVIKQYVDNKNLEKKFKNMGEGASNFYKGTKEADGYLDKFKYNYTTGTVDYLK